MRIPFVGAVVSSIVVVDGGNMSGGGDLSADGGNGDVSFDVANCATGADDATMHD